ncbi:hypothetical protein DRW07_11170 [Alteromonas sediminis]|uniref:Sulfotransferase family protein n=1 Tax=Alteromonas sediminis TaxID=2259342 RepID=A0A3N5YBX8_9ALTE|nr:sulfotransferase family 2 domain-containing protein [Alteromonas sediminis]RPJ66635.1 hypothetical protein DRW07_11170 [Alteromonas sediminis]
MRSKKITLIRNRLRKTLYHSLRTNDARLPLLFVHTPKTGGTSFRMAAERSKKFKHVFCDYGEDNNKTTPVLNQLGYKLEGKEKEIGAFLSTQKDYMLTGHFGADKHMHHFFPYQSVIFIRDPVDRVISEYHHKTRLNEYSGSIEAFIREPRFKNVQYHQFGSLNPVYWGFVGLCEQYRESLSLINILFNLDLQLLRENQNPGKSQPKYKVDTALRELIVENNAKDMQIYGHCKALLSYRLSSQKQCVDWLYGGWRFTKTKIIGKAFKAFSNTPVTLALLINNKEVAQCKAEQHNPISCKGVRQPLQGHIGFTFNLNKLPVLNDDDNVEVVCAHSGQHLFRMD